MVTPDNSLSPPPLTPPPIKNDTVKDSSGGSSASSYSYNPSLFIIAAILAFVCVASVSIHLLLRFLSRFSSSSPPLIHRNASSSSATTTASSSSATSAQNWKALLDSLPLFSLASSLASLPKSSPDCAVCLSRFHPHDELRLLPNCRHAFHSPCIGTWLRSTPSCPLCRSSIDLPPHPPPPPQESDGQNQTPESDSVRLEIGSVSHRRAPEDPDPAPAPTTRSYSLGSSFEYRVEVEVEAVVARMAMRVETNNASGPPPPGAEVASSAGGGGKGWLKEYVDQLASSASSSFSSLRFSSRRFDGGGSWDLESDGSGEDGRRSSFYKSLAEASS